MAAQDNSRLWVLVPSGDRPGPTEPAGETLASLVLIGPSAHVRGPVLGLSIRALRRQATLAPVRTTSARPRRSASAVKSRPWQLAVARAHQETSARPRGVAPRAIRAHGSSLSLVLIGPSAHVRGPVPGLSIRGGCTPGNSCPWQLASLVLIEPPAHVRGPVPGLSIRALGRRLNAASVRATSARARRGLCAVLSPPLGRGPSAAQKRKLGKQRPQARLFQQGAASQAAGRMRPFFQKSCKKPFTFSTLAQYTGG